MPIATEAVIADEAHPDRAGLAREVNAHILALEARVREMRLRRDSEELLIGLFCECGCMASVTMTRTDYEREGGAWIEGHQQT